MEQQSPTKKEGVSGPPGEGGSAERPAGDGCSALLPGGTGPLDGTFELAVTGTRRRIQGHLDFGDWPGIILPEQP